MQTQKQRRVLEFLSLACLIFLGGCSLFGGEDTHYAIEGAEGDAALKTYLDSILADRLKTEIDEDKDSPDFGRAESYREQSIAGDLLAALKAKGYYDGRVRFHDEENEKTFSGAYRVRAGALYTVSAITVEPAAFHDQFDFTLIDQSMPLEAERVLLAQAHLYRAVQKDKCYFAMDVTHEVVLDKQNKTAALTYKVEIGPEAEFGRAIFTGMTSVEQAYLQKLVPWREGDCFRREKIETLKTKLLESGLFSTAESTMPDAPDEDRRVNVTMRLKERAHRSVKLGANYYTDTGPGIVMGWEHRNFFGQAEKLAAELEISQIEQSLGFDFTKPFFLRDDQSLNINSELRLQQTDAYDEMALDIGAKLNRQFSRKFSGATGLALTLTEISEEGKEDKTYGLVSFPTSVVYDSRDDQLNPQKGWYLTGGVRPYFDALGESDPFTKLEAGARTYWHFSDTPDLTLALRADLGSIIGSTTTNVPATERFYAGGGGSVRGFGYQEVGPQDEKGDPTGGRSLATGSVELRTKFTDTMGAVAFIDAGSVSDSAQPDFDNLAVGAGLGFRYYTGFGPIRFDVAVPLNQRDELEQTYQFYISIGQAF